MDGDDNIGLADIAQELGDLRANMRKLKAREQVLRRAFLDARPNGPVRGKTWVLEVARGSARRFDRSLLPPEILNDPQYWVKRSTCTVVAKACPAPVNRPKQPKTTRPVLILSANEPEFSVIDSW